MRSARAAVVLSLVALVVGPGFGVVAGPAQETSESSGRPEGGDWPMYRGSLAGTGFSALDQIDASNVTTLTEAWTYSLAPTTEGGRGPNSQATPIVVGELMYVPTADRVVALDPVTGTEVWSYQARVGRPSRRGVSYWAGQDGMSPRIIFTTGQHLRALDAATGIPVATFGEAGAVDMVVPYNSVPLIYGNIVVVGANTPAGTIGGIGNARAFDARTGAKVWEFSSVAQPGEPGHDTWAGDSWRNRLGANAWPFFFSMDAARGLLFLPLASPIPGDYGGDRPGDNLYGNSLVAVDIDTGDYRWHFQTIHHDLWDADPPAPPALFDISRGDGTIPALGVTTKSGYLYILHRETGEPIYGVEERPVAASDVPGEATAPTQPIPVKPVGLSKLVYEPNDLVTGEDTSPEHAAACRDLVGTLGALYNAGPFTPWVFRSPGAPLRTTISFPGGVGGANWGGVSVDPATGYLLIGTQDLAALGFVEAAPSDHPVPYRKGAQRPASFTVQLNDQIMPCHRPPWGRLTAVDAATGDVVWQETLGVTDQLPEGRQTTGRPIRAGAITTASGLAFVAGTDDSRLRAFESATGRLVWTARLPRSGNANPMTYLGTDGKQYVSVAATDTLVTFAVP
ncbi:MAG: PQQ-binding-like beta-propeller repeat protein [Acidobacteriota bacterium]|nr:PQQ-binding-like beta-propeller repeat protein [Acidobacteriota bacterium]